MDSYLHSPPGYSLILGHGQDHVLNVIVSQVLASAFAQGLGCKSKPNLFGFDSLNPGIFVRSCQVGKPNPYEHLYGWPLPVKGPCNWHTNDQWGVVHPGDCLGCQEIVVHHICVAVKVVAFVWNNRGVAQ